MHTANRAAVTGKLASSGQLLPYPTTGTRVELGVVLVVSTDTVVLEVVSVAAVMVVGSLSVVLETVLVD